MNQLEDYIFDAAVDGGILTLIKDHNGNVNDKLLLQQVAFLNTKVDEAEKNKNNHIVFVHYIIRHYETIFGNIKYKEIYNCIK